MLKPEKKSETIHSALVDTIPDLFIRFRKNGEIIFCNKCHLFKLKPDEIIGRNLKEIYPAEVYNQFVHYIKKALETKSRIIFEFQHYDKTELNEFEVRMKACGENELFALIRDITKSKHFEIEFQKSEKKFRILLESAAQAIIVVNIHGQITLINTKADELFGYKRDELIDQPIEILIPERLKSKHVRHRNEFLARPSTREMGTGMELMAIRKDGTEFPIEVGLSSIEIYEGTFVMAFITDITERKELEKKLRQVEKLEAIGQLAGGVAHDFNNVLAGIIGLSELAVRKTDKNESPKDNLKLIIDKAESAANLVRQLLTFSRKQIVATRKLNLNAIINQNIKLLQRYLGEEILLKTKMQEGIFSIEADESALDQIITNLCINARDAMPDGGEIYIQTENVILDDYRFTDTGEMQKGNYIKLSIIDHGIGMTKEVRRHIFEPFFTTKDIGEGTGLGLSIVYGLVNQLNGFMNCKSRLGEGTIFEIFFSGMEETLTTVESSKSTKVKHGTETVLLVENEADLLATYKSTLESFGYNVIIASNGLTALNIYEKKGNSIDIIVSDVVMPKMGGVELKLVAQRINPELKILFISAYSDKMEPGAHLLQKPFRAKELAFKVREVLDQN